MEYLIEPGEVVLYMPHPGHATAYPMFVCDVGDDSLDGIVYTCDSGTIRGTPRTGVVADTDQRLRDPQFVHNLVHDGDGGVFSLSLHRIRTERKIKRLEEALVRLASGKKVDLAGMFDEEVSVADEAPQPAPKNEAPQPLPKMSERFKSSEPSDEEKAAKQAALSLAKV